MSAPKEFLVRMVTTEDARTKIHFLTPGSRDPYPVDDPLFLALGMMTYRNDTNAREDLFKQALLQELYIEEQQARTYLVSRTGDSLKYNCRYAKIIRESGAYWAIKLLVVPGVRQMWKTSSLPAWEEGTIGLSEDGEVGLHVPYVCFSSVPKAMQGLQRFCEVEGWRKQMVHLHTYALMRPHDNKTRPEDLRAALALARED